MSCSCGQIKLLRYRGDVQGLPTRNQSLGDAETPLDVVQQQYAAVRRKPTAGKGDGHFRVANGWQIEGKSDILIHRGRGAP